MKFGVTPSPLAGRYTARLALCAALAALPMATLAQPQNNATDAGSFEQRGVHEHGRVTVNLVVEGATLSLELDAPAINVIGFERAPRNAAEQRRVADVDAWLRSGAGMLAVPTAAQCTRASVSYQPPKPASSAKTAKSAKQAQHDHDHDHDHDHAQHDDHDHADYQARYSYNCRNAAALQWADLTLIARLVDVEAVEVNLVTPSGQSQRRLTATDRRVPLR
jgi:hypothetical protein